MVLAGFIYVRHDIFLLPGFLLRLGIFLQTSEGDNDGLFQSDDRDVAPVRQNSGHHVTLAPRLSVTATTLHTVALSSGVHNQTDAAHLANKLYSRTQSFWKEEEAAVLFPCLLTSLWSQRPTLAKKD